MLFNFSLQFCSDFYLAFVVALQK